MRVGVEARLHCVSEWADAALELVLHTKIRLESGTFQRKSAQEEKEEEKKKKKRAPKHLHPCPRSGGLKTVTDADATWPPQRFSKPKAVHRDIYYICLCIPYYM